MQALSLSRGARAKNKEIKACTRRTRRQKTRYVVFAFTSVLLYTFTHTMKVAFDKACQRFH